MKVKGAIIDCADQTATVSFCEFGKFSRNKIVDAMQNGRDLYFSTSMDLASIPKPKKEEESSVDLTDAKVIFQDETTILIVDGKKYFAKPEKGEKFDAEKGLLVCLMKCAGLKTTDFLDLMKNAKMNKKTVKCDKVKLKKRVK